MRAIWKDSATSFIIVFIICLSMVILMSLINEERSVIDVVVKYLVITFFGIKAISIGFIKLNFITSDGVRVGNLIPEKEKSTFLRRSSVIPTITLFNSGTFVSWENIEFIKIYGKEFSIPFGSWVSDYLSIKTKQGKIHECLIKDTKRFIETIKKLNKSSYLTKDSKYALLPPSKGRKK